MLINVDLAIVGSKRSGGRHQTGTTEFTAIELLRGADHTYRHHLDSLFYVLWWICARRAWEKEFQCKARDRPTRNILMKRYGTNLEDVTDASEVLCMQMGLRIFWRSSRQRLMTSSLCAREVRDIQFPLIKGGKLDLAIKLDSRDMYSAEHKVFGANLKNRTLPCCHRTLNHQNESCYDRNQSGYLT